MKYYIKQKVFSFGDKFTIKNEYGNDCFFVQGEVFSWGKKLHMYDLAGNEVAYIRQRVWAWMPKFEVYLNGQYAMEVKKEFTFFRPQYTLLNTDWKIDGDYFAHEYYINSPTMHIAHISKHWFTWGDSYEIEVMPGVNDMYVLAAVLAIDAAVASQNNE